MLVLTGRRTARALPWLRLLALLPLSLFLGHGAIFSIQYGFGDNLRTAMSAGGHDSYWLAFSIVITALTALYGAREGLRAIGLQRRLSRAEHGPLPAGVTCDPETGGSWRREFRSIWPLLFLVTAIGFVVQENLEHLALGQTPHGIGSLIGTEHPFAVPVLALVSAAVAALGALVRWRVRILEARVERAIRDAASRRPRTHAFAPAREWPHIGSLRGLAWLLVRLQAGRAPPSVA